MYCLPAFPPRSSGLRLAQSPFTVLSGSIRGVGCSRTRFGRACFVRSRWAASRIFGIALLCVTWAKVGLSGTAPVAQSGHLREWGFSLVNGTWTKGVFSTCARGTVLISAAMPPVWLDHVGSILVLRRMDHRLDTPLIIRRPILLSCSSTQKCGSV